MRRGRQILRRGNDPTFGDTAGQKFLRGYQLTDANGRAPFTTIYPGWYEGRTVHIHFKIRAGEASAGEASAPSYEFTSQLFFDDELTDLVHSKEPYASRGVRTLRNDGDNIYGNTGVQLLLDCQETTDGYEAPSILGCRSSQPALVHSQQKRRPAPFFVFLSLLDDFFLCLVQPILHPD